MPRTDSRGTIFTQMHRLAKESNLSTFGGALATLLEEMDRSFDPNLGLSMKYLDFDRYYTYLRSYLPRLSAARRFEYELLQRQLVTEAIAIERITAVIGHDLRTRLICSYISRIYGDSEKGIHSSTVWFALMFAAIFLTGKCEQIKPEEDEETFGHTL